MSLEGGAANRLCILGSGCEDRCFYSAFLGWEGGITFRIVQLL